MQWQAIVDFDGTITRQDTTDQILERYADPAWEAVEAEWVQGKIGSAECMRRQIELLRVTPATLDAFAAQIEIDWGFLSFVRHCGRLNVPLTVVSDGLDRIIRVVLARVGLGWLPVVANRLEWTGEDRWQLTPPVANRRQGCKSGTCKCAIADNPFRPMTLLVGDGKSDQCVAGEADLVFAKRGLIAYCRDKDIPHRPISDFSGAVSLLNEVVTTTVPSMFAPVRAKELSHG